VVKIVLAISFLLLLTVPASFYRDGRKGALGEAAFVALLFSLAAWGRRWMSFFKIDSPPSGLNGRILTALAVTIVLALCKEVPTRLRGAFVPILSGVGAPLLFGLLGHPRAPWWFTNPGFWKKPEYRVATIVLGVWSAALVAMSWPSWRWWSLLAVPGFILGVELGELIGRSLRRWVLALEGVWEIARQMGPPIGGFVLGYLVIASVFAGLFASVWRADSAAFKGLPEHPSPADFAYHSVMTISTTGYGDVAPQSPPAKILASAEALVGLGWTVVVFAAVLTVVQRRLEQQRSESHDGHRL
jgi:hypothetical protein